MNCSVLIFFFKYLNRRLTPLAGNRAAIIVELKKHRQSITIRSNKILMKIYVLDSSSDNPLFEGLAMEERPQTLDTWPTDWRAKYQTWQPKLLQANWKIPEVVGNVRTFNDYPCINMSRPAFSQRAVDLLRDILEPNGELLPVRHKCGTYYFYNCTQMTNCVDLSQSDTRKIAGGIITTTDKLTFIDELLEDLTIFKVRTQLIELFCTQRFVDRVNAAGLQGFVFQPIWPLPEGVTFNDEMYRTWKESEKWKPKGLPEVEIKGNAVVLRLYCAQKKANKNELAAVEAVMTHLEKSLYDVNQATAESYFGNVEGHDVVDSEIRVFLSAPDCDRLVSHLMLAFRSLPWPAKFHVVNKRGEYVDESAAVEYVRMD